MKINLSLDKVEQIQGFFRDVVVFSGQRSDEGVDSIILQFRGELVIREIILIKLRGELFMKDGIII